MAILTVGPTSTFPTIAAAMTAAGTGDIISLEAGYGNENATVTVDGLSFDGGSSSTDVNLQLGTGISAITLLGTAPINVLDGPDANTIVGNDGDNIISVSSGVDVVNAGNGIDRLIVDYSAATAAITGTPVGVTDGGTHAVTFTGVENFTISTGSGNDTITVGDGDNVVNTGAGNDTITAGNGPNIIDGGAGNDTINAGNGVNTIQGGDGNDTIVAGNGGNTIDGGAGDDGITTGAGNDIVNAGLGNDTVITGAGNDVTTVNGGIDTVDSGADTDRLIVDYSSSTTNVNGGVTGGTLAGGYDGAFADVAGTSSVVFQHTENFTVTTGVGNDVIATGDGADVLDGGAGSDQLNAGGGDDILLIGLGSDALDGGAGIDTALFDGARADYQITDLGGGVIQSVDLRPGSPDGTDTLVNIEGFTFTDGTFDGTTVLNNPPTLGGDLGVTVADGGTVTVTTADLTASDIDSTNAQLVYTVTGAQHGTVMVGGIAAASFTEADLVANTVSFQHDGSGSNGNFSVSLTDGVATPQTATVTVTEVNVAPVAVNDTLSAVAEDSGQTTILGSALTGNDSTGANESGQTLTVTAVSNVIGGSAIVSGGNVLFTPGSNFNGPASFDYTVTDNGATNGAPDPLTATATASFTVTPVNDAPVARDDDFAATETNAIGSGLNVFNDNGHGADSDVDGDPLTVNTVNGGAANVGAMMTLASGALLSVNADGTFTYDPNHVFDALPAAGSGATNTTATDTFTYTDTDGTASSGTATVTVTVTGVDSNDTLQGSFGPGTTLAGGILNDTYIVHNSATAINDVSGTTDVVYAEGVSVDLAANAAPGIEVMIVENGTGITGTGYATTANTLYSLSTSSESITLVGGGAGDFLAGGQGADSLQGGGGDDVYVVHSTATTIGDSGGTGDAVLVEGVNFALTDGDGVDTATLENGTGHTLTGHATEASVLYSVDTADQSNTLIGGSGGDFLSGSSAADILQGGDGNDTYVVHSVGATVSDSGGATDVVYAEGVNLTLMDGDGVDDVILENGTGLTATGHATEATTLYSLSTADQSNTLIGGNGADFLSGGLGADHLQGGGGDDIFVVNSAATTVSDTGGEDVVRAEGLSFALTDGDGIESLILDGNGMTATGHATTASTLYSMGTGNTLVGGSATDLLVAGDHGDTLVGGTGNDFLVGGAGNDVFTFSAGTGTDLVYNFHPHDGGANQDTVQLTGQASGTTFDSMVANHQIFEVADASQPNGANIVVQHDASDYAVLQNLHLADVSASDFLFA